MARRRETQTVHSEIARIESYRARLDLPHDELCALSGVRPLTWWRLRKGLQTPRAETMERLDKGLDNAIEAQRRAGRPTKTLKTRTAYGIAHSLVVSTLGGGGIFKMERFKPEQIKSRDRGIGAQARAVAIFLLNTKLGKRPAEIARTIGMSQPGVTKAIKRVPVTYDDKWLDRLGQKFLKEARRTALKK